VEAEPLWAPPLLLIVTPGATSVEDEVEPADEVMAVVDWVVMPAALVESGTVEDGGVAAVEPAAVEPEDTSVESVPEVSVSVVPVLSADEVDESVSSAKATPGEVITAMPIPKAAARAPTRPM
jgi:hypothetical protein